MEITPTTLELTLAPATSPPPVADAKAQTFAQVLDGKVAESPGMPPLVPGLGPEPPPGPVELRSGEVTKLEPNAPSKILDSTERTQFKALKGVAKAAVTVAIDPTTVTAILGNAVAMVAPGLPIPPPLPTSVRPVSDTPTAPIRNLLPLTSKPESPLDHRSEMSVDPIVTDASSNPFLGMAVDPVNSSPVPTTLPTPSISTPSSVKVDPPVARDLKAPVVAAPRPKLSTGHETMSRSVPEPTQKPMAHDPIQKVELPVQREQQSNETAAIPKVAHMDQSVPMAKPPVPTEPKIGEVSKPQINTSTTNADASSGQQPKQSNSGSPKGDIEIKGSKGEAISVKSLDKPALKEAASKADPLEVVVSAPVRASAATATKVSAAQAVPQIDRAKVVQQVADRIQTLAATNNKQGVVVHLEPKALGTITLVVKSISSTVDAQIFASHEHVRQTLEQSRPELNQALAQKGLNLASVTVANESQAPSTSSGDARQFSGNASQSGNSSQQARSGSQPGTQSQSQPQARPKSRKGPGVDVWI